MTPTALRAQAQEFVAKARAALDEGLADGDDTEPHRARLDAAMAKLKSLEIAQAPVVDLDVEDQIAAEAQSMLDGAQANILAELAAFQPPAPSAPTLPMGPAMAVVRARRADAADLGRHPGARGPWRATGRPAGSHQGQA